MRKIAKTLFNHRKDKIKINDLNEIIDTIEFIRPTGDLKLKSCPFCSSNAVYYFKYKHIAGIRYGCVCLNCMAQINPGYAQSEYTAMKMWNRRDICQK